MGRLVIALMLILSLATAGRAATVCEKAYGYYYETARDTASDHEYVICNEPPRSPLVPELKPPPLAIRFGQNTTPAESSAEAAPMESLTGRSPAAYRLEKIIHFRFASAKVDGALAIDTLARVLKADPLVLGIRVKGFTCDLGPKGYNDRLAMKRALAVASLLGKAGVKIEDVSGEGKCCYVPGARRLSRRVEISVMRAQREEKNDEK